MKFQMPVVKIRKLETAKKVLLQQKVIINSHCRILIPYNYLMCTKDCLGFSFFCSAKKLLFAVVWCCELYC